MVSAIRIEMNVPMKMRDGVTLRADVYRPDDKEKHPAIIVRTPYSKTYSHHSDYLSAHQAAVNGYAFVVQDVRGRFASEGSGFTIGAAEGLDGYDTVEGVAAEPWCDGNVGMVGCSYLGRNQWQAAFENPPHLKAISPSVIGSGPLMETRLTGVCGYGLRYARQIEQAGQRRDRGLGNPQASPPEYYRDVRLSASEGPADLQN